jgi:hypothetical protein
MYAIYNNFLAYRHRMRYVDTPTGIDMQMYEV